MSGDSGLHTAQSVAAGLNGKGGGQFSREKRKVFLKSRNMNIHKDDHVA